MTSTLRPPLSIHVSERNDLTVIALAGRLDQTLEERLEGIFNQLLEKSRVRVIVDLGDLDFLNSRGVSVFIAAIDDLRAAGGDLKLARVPEQSRVILQRLGVDRLLQQFEAIDEAVRGFDIPIQDFLSQGGLDVFIAAPRGKTFHASGCSKVKRLKSVNILPSKKAARDAGLSPCSRCCG